MRYWYRALGEHEAGSTVEVHLRGSSANVRLLNEPNFHAYRKAQPFAYSGGFNRRTPVHLTIPNDGRWWVVADLGGSRGRVRITDVQVSPPADDRQGAPDQHVEVGPAPSRLH